MPHYMLRVKAPNMSYLEHAKARHIIEARSLEDATYQADNIIDNHYFRLKHATMELFDESGLADKCTSDEDWESRRQR